MRVSSRSLLAPLSQRGLPSLHAKNIHKFVNKIPCHAESIRTPPSVQYVLEQMQHYPSTPDPTPRNHLDHHFPPRSRTLAELAHLLPEKLNYLEIEQFREMLEQMPAGEAQNHRKVLKQFHKKVHSKIQKHRLGEYVLEAATKLMEQISQILKGKSALIV